MKDRRLRFVLLASCVTVLVGTLVTALFMREWEEAAGGEGNLPPALSRHLEQLKQALPGTGGESSEGPGSADELAFFQRAFPDQDIPLARFETAQADARAIRARGFATGKGRPGTWVTVGPSNALYPFSEFRTNSLYVPNEYAAGGRTTALAIAPVCVPGNCRLWAATSGGGVWRTDNALTGEPHWTYLSASFAGNAVGSITVDPNDPSGNTVWAGTGEGNTCGSGCVAGVGVYKSTDGGNTWTGPLGSSVFKLRGVGTIAVKPGEPDTIYAGSAFAVTGHASSCCYGGGTPYRALIPGAPPWGLYRSTDAGASWTYIHNGAATIAECGIDIAAVVSNATPCSPRGVRKVVIDPSNADIVYAASYARGVWRSSDGGTTWTQIKPSLNTAQVTTRPEIAVTPLPYGKTRMYLAEGNIGDPYSRLFRSDDVATGSPVFTDLTSSSLANPGYGSYNYCTGQCWYDNFVVTPAGHPDIVYLGGSYQYGETGGISNGRGVVLSTDAGVSFTDMTMDSTDAIHPNAMHPDQHSLVTNPNNPYQFFEASDGGIVRSSGELADASVNCGSRGLAGAALTRCSQLLSRVPTLLESLNKGLTTLQFQSLSVSPFNANLLQGGTQDNGTWQSTGNPVKWLNMMVGDGGQSGFDAVNPHFRFHTFFDASPDVNFSDGAIADWNWVADPIFGTGALFYVPIISDPRVSGTMFVGTLRVMRTKTHGRGSMTLAELRQHCNEWTGDFAVTCGDWVQLGPTTLTTSTLGDRSGGTVAAVERAPSDTSTLWAATTNGRVFVSKNAAAEPASSVAFVRIDSLASNDPNRFVTGIYIDPTNPNRAWISYSGFNAATPTLPGHVFEVVYSPSAGTATWTSLDYDLGDLPITDVVRDRVSGDLFASSDFGVFRLASGSTSWTLAAPGMPNVSVAGLTIVPGARKLYAATHGLGAWLLNLPSP